MLPLSYPEGGELEAALGAARAALRRGEVVGMPTDTVYGLASAIDSGEGVELLFRIKGRPAVKPVPILAASIDQAGRVGVIAGPALEAARLHWPGALTLVVPRVPGLPDWVGEPSRGSVGIRVPAHPVALALLEGSGPLAVTSANRSGEAAAVDDAGARATFGDEVAVYLPGAGAGWAPSTVVDFTRPVPRVLRAGPVAWGQ